MAAKLEARWSPSRARALAIAAVRETFEETGRTVPYSPAIDKQRAKFDLPPLGEVPMDEIHALLEPAEGEPS